MTNNPDRAEPHFSLLRDCSHMDASVVERLRATVQVSQEWAEQALDVIIQLDDDLQALDAMVKQQIHSLTLHENFACEETGNRIPCLEEIANQTELRVQHLRNGVRDLMMSMMQQDVIGQAIERSANALEKRVAAIGKVVVGLESSHLHTTEIAEIHRIYRADDNLHRTPGFGEGKYETAA
jgi:hypothetical protein